MLKKIPLKTNHLLWDAAYGLLQNFRLAPLVGATLLIVGGVASFAQSSNIPEGFTAIFDGKTLKGWHWSLTNHHGSNGLATVENGAIALRQRPYGQGGLFITDKKYRNFELYLEVKAPFGCNSGILPACQPGSAGNRSAEGLERRRFQFVSPSHGRRRTPHDSLGQRGADVGRAGADQRQDCG